MMDENLVGYLLNAIEPSNKKTFFVPFDHRLGGLADQNFSGLGLA